MGFSDSFRRFSDALKEMDRSLTASERVFLMGRPGLPIGYYLDPERGNQGYVLSSTGRAQFIMRMEFEVRQYDESPRVKVGLSDQYVNLPDSAIFVGMEAEDYAYAMQIAATECEGVSASWCPNCGDCICDREEGLDNPRCPLHRDGSAHCEGVDKRIKAYYKERTRMGFGNGEHELVGQSVRRMTQPTDQEIAAEAQRIASIEEEMVSCTRCGTTNNINMRKRCRSCATVLKKPKQETKEQKMNKQPEGTFNMAKGAFVEGSKFAGAKKANETVVRGVKAGLRKAGVPDEVLDTEIAQTLLVAISPMMIHLAADRFPGVIPQADLVKAGCTRAMTVASMEAVEKVLDPVIQAMLPALRELASDMAKAEKDAEVLSAVPQEPAEAAAAGS